MQIVFARTRYEYRSYSDLWRLVELSEFPICRVDEIDLAQDTLYVTAPVNGELRPHIAHRRSILKGAPRARIVWWNLERPDSGRWTLANIGIGASNDVEEILNWVDAVWASDRWFASLDGRMLYVPLGSHRGLAGTVPPRGAFEWDLAHLSYITSRREMIYRALEPAVRLAPNAWPPERERVLSRSRAMLNIHQTPAPIAEPLRFAIAAAHAIPLLTETLADPWPLVPGEHCLMASHGAIAKRVVEWLQGGSLEALGGNLARLLCDERPFRRGVEEAAKITCERIAS